MKKLSTMLASALLAGTIGFINVATAAEAKVDDATLKTLTAAFKKIIPGAKIDAKSVAPAPIPNMYEVTVGPYVYYISKDGKYLFEGSLYDVATKKNLTQPRLLKARMSALNAIGEKNMIVFSPKKDKIKHTITVFTDVDCPYCRLMHQQIGMYNKLGIKVRYMLFPRAPENTPTFNKAVSVWCSKDRNKAFTAAKSGKAIPKKSCVNPVKKSVQIGSAMGVTGTPSIISDDGHVIPGFVAPKELIKILDHASAAAKAAAEANKAAAK